MICSNCGFQNEGTSKFCMKCGNVMVQQMQQPTPEAQPMQKNFQQSTQLNNNFGGATNEFLNSQSIQNSTATEFTTNNVQPQQDVQPQQTQSYNSSTAGSLNYMFFILAVLLKPITSIKEELHKFENTKTSIIFAGIISVVTTIISLIKTIFSTVYTPASPGFYGYGATEAHWAWDNLKNLNWGEAIFKNFLLYAGALLAIALVYYLASLIIKKKASFQRLLGIASISAIPIILCSLVISPLIAKLYSPLGIIVTIIGAVYTLILLLDGINREMAFEDNDTKIYTNLACLSILVSVGYYAFMKFLFAVSEVGTELEDLTNLLN